MLISEIKFTKPSYMKISNSIIYNTNYPDGVALDGMAIFIKSPMKQTDKLVAQL